MAVAATDRGSTAHMEQRTSPPQGQELANLEEDPINLPLHEERYEPLVAAMDELGAGVSGPTLSSPAWSVRRRSGPGGATSASSAGYGVEYPPRGAVWSRSRSA